MARTYKHIQSFEKEIAEMAARGMTHREIGEALGFTREQVKGYVKRLHKKQRRLEAGEALKKPGRPAKDSPVTEEDKIAELKYKLARKDARIKELEMENELMRDFLSLTGRK